MEGAACCGWHRCVSLGSATKEPLNIATYIGVRFIADDKGELVSRLGLIFDASPLLGSPRSKVSQSGVSLCNYWVPGPMSGHAVEHAVLLL